MRAIIVIRFHDASRSQNCPRFMMDEEKGVVGNYTTENGALSVLAA